MNSTDAASLLEKLLAGRVTCEQVLRAFQAAPAIDLGFANLDTHRALRKGFPEVVYAQGKTLDQVLKIAERLRRTEKQFLITRLDAATARTLRRRLKGAVYHPLAHCVTFEKPPLAKRPGIIAVLAAGTSDLPVAEEAAVTAEVMGNRVARIFDVGVAGLHRLLRRLDDVQAANVVIAVAGMEGALPGVVAGLVARPVIAVPTSVGYGANLGGLTALFGMLSSCSSGLTVVNIDNGFGAGYAASQINALASGPKLGSRERTHRTQRNGPIQRR